MSKGEGDYCGEAFFEVLRKVMNGLLPFEALLGHTTYQERARKISAYYGRGQFDDAIFVELNVRVFLNLDTFIWVNEDDDFFKWTSMVARNYRNDLLREKRRAGRNISIGPSHGNDRREDRDGTISEERLDDENRARLCDTNPNPELQCRIHDWIAGFTPLQKQIYRVLTEPPLDNAREVRKISTREIARQLTAQGVKCCHTIVAKEMNQMKESCRQIVGNIGKRNRAQSRSV